MIINKKKADSRGFTLIELMIVVAIIGILAAVAVPKFAEMIRKSKEGATKGGLSSIRSALTIYVSDNEGLLPLQAATLGNSPAVAAGQTAGQDMLNLAMRPKYLDDWGNAKLGEYHSDSSQFAVTLSTGRGSVINTGVGTLASLAHQNGWLYTSVNGGSFWVNCSHTDTKNTFVSDW